MTLNLAFTSGWYIREGQLLEINGYSGILRNLAKLAKLVYLSLGNCASESVQLLFWSYCIMIYSGKDKLMLGNFKQRDFIEQNGLIETEEFR